MTHSQEYNISVVGNACKWGATHRKDEATFDLKDCIYSFNYAISSNQKFRGHNLCWGNNNPKWLLNGNYNAEQLSSILETHITTVMKGVRAGADGDKPAIYAWDVVNEAIGYDSDKKKWGFKAATPWYPTLTNYVDLAFTYARKADPEALLFYNDYNVVSTDVGKANAIYDMAKSMIDRKIPIDGIGLQMHVKVEDKLSWDTVSKTIAKFGTLGLKVHITELDVTCSKCDGTDE